MPMQGGSQTEAKICGGIILQTRLDNRYIVDAFTSLYSLRILNDDCKTTNPLQTRSLINSITNYLFGFGVLVLEWGPK